MSDAGLTKAGIEVQIGPHKLVMRPLTDRDLVEMDEWVRSSVMDVALRTLERVDKQSLRDEVLRNALKTASTVGWYSREGFAMMATPNGLARLLHQSAGKPRSPTVEELAKHLTDPASVSRVETTFRRLNLTDGEPPKEGSQESGTSGETTSTESSP